jgi:hypothetical protein
VCLLQFEVIIMNSNKSKRNSSTIMSLFKKFQINFLDIVFFMFSLRIFESLGKSLKPNALVLLFTHNINVNITHKVTINVFFSNKI